MCYEEYKVCLLLVMKCLQIPHQVVQANLYTYPFFQSMPMTLNTFILYLKATDCAELYKSGRTVSGVYTVDPDGSGAFNVYCDQTTAGGGWTVFQKRIDGSVDFNRTWDDYKHGFGNLVGEFWLGLDKINRLTQNKTKNKLRVDLRAITNKIVHPEYDWFGIATETNKYRLYIGKMTTSKSSINQFFSLIVRIISLLPLHRQRVLLAPFPLILLLATNKECFFPALYRLAMFSSESHSSHAQLSPHPSVENGNLLSRLLESDSLDILRKSKL